MNEDSKIANFTNPEEFSLIWHIGLYFLHNLFGAEGQGMMDSARTKVEVS
jgi:hypothetical protein